MGKKFSARILPFMGILFLSAYIRSAVVDVVYTDYIRLVNSYLPDAYDFMPYMQADILTRIPINYIQRIINVLLFGYSTIFDMMLGACFLGVFAYIISKYIVDKNLGIFCQIITMMIIFSLNKWEMLLNGSGWVHFLAFACFVYHYYIYDKVYYCSIEDDSCERITVHKKPSKSLMILPILTILFCAGPYSGVYVLVLTLFYLFEMYQKGKEIYPITVKRILCLWIPLCLYMISRYFSVEEYAGAVKESMFTVFARDPISFIGFVLQFFIQSFASMVFGLETIQRLGIPKFCILFIGLMIFMGYLYAIYINIKHKVYDKTIFPLILLVSGLLNHILIALARWIFMNPDYGMSSRYALQYQVGILGLILSFYYMKKLRAKRDYLLLVLIILCVSGNIITTNDEINVAKYRKENFEIKKEAALHFEEYSEEELKKIFQYHSGEKTRQALEILKENHWNVFRD